MDATVPALRLAVEADGPTHFFRNDRAPMGATLLKRRHLAALGWRVVPVPHWEWDAAGGGAERRAWLARAFAAAASDEL